jgi:hypothetical protein
VTDPIRWTRIALDARLDALEARYEGRELIAAVVEFADTLTTEDRRLLQDALLARAKQERLRRLRRRYAEDDEQRGSGRG